LEKGENLGGSLSIIIIGAGQIGQFIASKLSTENKDVIIIEDDESKLAELSEELDAQIVHGNGASPAALKEAGINEAQMLIAVTDSDEVNLLACMMANLESKTPIKVARVRKPGFDQEILDQLNIDMVINPDREAADAILRILTVPGSVDVIDFFDGKMKIVGVRVKEDSEIANFYLENLSALLKNEHLLITTILRDGETIIPYGRNKLLPKDLVYFVTESENIPKIMKLFGYKSEKVKRVMIHGGGHIGLHLAGRLEEKELQVKVIEKDNKLCSKLVRNLDKTVVLNETGTDQQLLAQENVSDMDAFISVTNDDENNVLSSLLAKRLGTPWTITLTNEINYIPLITTIGVDVVVSPRLIANSEILHFIRQGKVLSVFTLQEDLEILEIEALDTSEIANKAIKDAKIPREALILCIERNNEAFIPNGDTIIQPNDKVLVQVTTKGVTKVEKLFTVKLEYF